MKLLNEITTNLPEWDFQKIDDCTTMYSRIFSGNIHLQLKSHFKSAYNLLSQNNRTIVINCFVTYTNIVILTES